MSQMWLFYEIKIYTQTSRVSYRKMVKNMEKQEAVDLMTKTIVDLNIEMARQNNVPEDQIEEVVKVSIPQMNMINTILYEVLEANGVIA
jgi:transcriptional/translational regulatory protein YebC/TACO1